MPRSALQIQELIPERIRALYQRGKLLCRWVGWAGKRESILEQRKEHEESHCGQDDLDKAMFHMNSTQDCGAFERLCKRLLRRKERQKVCIQEKVQKGRRKHTQRANR